MALRWRLNSARGAILELPDCLIAAVAIRLGLPLVAGNTSDFKALKTARVTLESRDRLSHVLYA